VKDASIKHAVDVFILASFRLFALMEPMVIQRLLVVELRCKIVFDGLCPPKCEPVAKLKRNVCEGYTPLNTYIETKRARHPCYNQFRLSCHRSKHVFEFSHLNGFMQQHLIVQ
jgi:hypothetical protein